MILVHFCLSILILSASTNSAVTFNKLTNISTNNLAYSGTITVDKQNLFFVFYGVDGETSADNLKNHPLVVAVGTPGRSAQYINVAGIGPKIIQKDMSLADNPNRITKFTNVLFLDLLGSGFSFPSSSDALPTNYTQYGAQLTSAINQFTAQSVGKSKKVYIVGESTFVKVLPGLDDITGLQAIFHISAWYDLYQIGKYYGTAGIDLKIFTDSVRITIQSTFSQCYTYQRTGKFTQAHACYDTIVNYIETNTKNRNLYNIQLISNLTQFLPMVQYYFSQALVVSAYKAPTTALFQSGFAQVQANLYDDFSKIIDTPVSQYFKDYLQVKQIFITADDDFLSYRKATRNWLQNSLSFVDSAKFKAANLTQYAIGGNTVGYVKSVTQVAYYQLLNAGHFAYNCQPAVIQNIISNVVAPSLISNKFLRAAKVLFNER